MSEVLSARVTVGLSCRELLDNVPAGVGQVALHDQFSRRWQRSAGNLVAPDRFSAQLVTIGGGGSTDVDLTNLLSTSGAFNATGKGLVALRAFQMSGPGDTLTIDGDVANGYDFLNDGEPLVLPGGAIWAAESPLLQVSASKKVLRLSGTAAGVWALGLLFADPNPGDFLARMPAADAMPNFIYGENGPWDAGACGTHTYEIDDDYWKFALAITWYAFYQESGLDRPFPDPGFNCNDDQTNNDVITGLPTAVEIFQGTVNRLKLKNADGLVGPYVSLAQIATTEGLQLLSTIAWPRTRPLWDPEDDSPGSWNSLGAEGWDNSDIDPGDLGDLGKWIDLSVEAVREKQATEVAAIIAETVEANPDVNLCFSDNFSVLIPDEDFDNLIDCASRFIEKITPLGVALLPNVTTSGMRGPTITGGDLSEHWDALATAGGPGVIGIYQESISNAHAMWASLFEEFICPNIQNWIRRDWPGGGKRALICLSQPEMDHHATNISWGIARRVVVTSGTVIDVNTIELVTSTPHYIDDTSLPTCVPENVHATLNGGQFTPTVINATTLRLTLTAHGISSITGLGATSWIHFPFSGYDTDFGMMHALREVGDATFNHWNPSTVDPKWIVGGVNDFATFGQVVPGSLAIVSTANVTDGNGDAHECVKEIKYQFAQGPSGERWHHIDFSMAGRRRWKASS